VFALSGQRRFANFFESFDESLPALLDAHL
jgi:hypothetical protein